MSNGLTPKEAAIVEACYFQPHYSKEASTKFWKEIVSTDDRTLYMFACALQDVESRALAVLNEYVRSQARKLVIAKRRKTRQEHGK